MNRYQLDAYTAIEAVKTQIMAFLRGSFRFRHPSLDEAVHRMIKERGLLAPVVVEPTFPYEEPSAGPKNLGELAAAGFAHPDLPTLLANASGDARWPADRPLYKHQVDALMGYRDGKSLVISSGTGSGKTESFLFPAIDTVLRDDDLTRPGVRVLVIYPLNALVNNQMERLRAILGTHPQIRFALYTRRLAQKQRDAERKLRAGEPRYPAEIISRERLRVTPPHIIITNFSMLEYALVRPADAPIFADAFAKPRMVVLDEAHVYAGSMAAEITMLLRRAWLRWGIQDPTTVQGIVTSATMQQGITDGEERLVAFASHLLSKTSSGVCYIGGRRVLTDDVHSQVDSALPALDRICALDLNFPTLREERTSFPDGQERRTTVFDDSEAARSAAEAVAHVLHPDAPRVEAPAGRLLWQQLEPLSWVRALRRQLHDGRALRVDLLAQQLFPQAKSKDTAALVATHKILGALAMARATPTGLPLLPARLHAIARGPSGVYACINPACSEAVVPGRWGALHADATRRCGCGSLVCELRVCESCGQSFITAQETSDEDGAPAIRPSAMGEISLFVPGDTWDDGERMEGGSIEHIFTAGDGHGRFAPAGVGDVFRRFEGCVPKGPARHLTRVKCPRCAAQTRTTGALRRVDVGADAVLQVLIDGLYPELPEHPSAEAGWLRGGGRRALLFADNRQVAAALAAKIEESHDLLLGRTILLQSLRAGLQSAASPEVDRLSARFTQLLVTGAPANEIAEAQAALKYAAQYQASCGLDWKRLVRALENHPSFRELSGYEPDATTQGLASMIVARELGRRPARLGNLEANGLVLVDYDFRPPAARHPDVARTFTGESWRALLEVLLDLLRTSGLTYLPDLETYRTHLNRNLFNRKLVREAASAHGDDAFDADDDGAGRIGMIPTTNRDSRRREYLDKVLQKLASPPTVTNRLVLEQAWDALEAAARAPDSCLRTDVDSRMTELSVPMARLRFRLLDGATAHRCPVCRTVWARHVALVCPTSLCAGVLQPVTNSDLDLRDRLVALATSTAPLYGLATQEHTAQIGTDKLEQAERKFKAGMLNALVCSTTMELGIDIGGLSATVLTNVPPGPSNYLQRAGRAGRRTEGTSLVLTFAKPRPFDQATFNDPDRPFKTRITPPRVQLESRRIIARHANAFLLTRFFRHYGAEADAINPIAALRTVGEFFDSPLSQVLVGKPGLERLVADVGRPAEQTTLSDAFDYWLQTVIERDLELAASVRRLVAGTILERETSHEIGLRAADTLLRITRSVRGQLCVLREQQGQERERPLDEQDRGLLTALELQELELVDEHLLGFLAEEQFLPRYGFPIQVVPLHHSWTVRPHRSRADETESELRLSRDIALALNEYAPGAEVVADKHLHRSSGLVRHWTGTDAAGTFSHRYVAVCGTCGRLQYARTKGEVRDPCPTCREDRPRTMAVISPLQGFAVRWGMPPRRWTSGMNTPMRPITETAYAARDGDSALEVSPALALSYDEEGQILVRTEGELDISEQPGAEQGNAGLPRAGFGYAICYLCGRAEPETQAAPDRGADPLPFPLRDHRRLRGDQPCAGVSQYWRHMALVGAVRTETLLIRLRGALEFPGGNDGRRLAITWMVALQLAAAEVLGVDSRQIGGLLVPRNGPGGVVHDVLLFDQVAGGAGHCKALRELWDKLLDAALQRLACTNSECSHGCHSCLIAFETQRYEDLLVREPLREFLTLRWGQLRTAPEREGILVAGLMRGEADLRDEVDRNAGRTLTFAVPSINPQALDECGWLRALLRHADGQGRVRLITEQLPDPADDDERFIADRLRVSMQTGHLDLYVARHGSCASGWRVGVQEPPAAFFLEEATEQGLGPDWLETGSAVYRADTARSRAEVVRRFEALVAASERIEPDALKPQPASDAIIVREVPSGCQGARAKFDAWLRGPGDESLFARPVSEVTVLDPYIATEWQLKLLAELISLAKNAGCKKVTVHTYAPKERDEGNGYGANRTCTAAEQLRGMRRLLADEKWNPMPAPLRAVERVHKRVLTGVRVDGTKFEVLFERGIDFFHEAARGGRATRETVLVIRDPLG